MEADLEGSTTLGASVQRSEAAVQNGSELWREMTKNDINSIVCHCAQECDVNITSREVMTALQSDLIPDVHPLREYILSLKPYTPDQPDWIDFVASQVRVADNAGSGVQEFRSSGVTSEQAQSATEPSEPLTSGNSASRLWRACFKKWFVAMVASWMKDEVVNHQVLVLIGKQGIYKTTWLEHLIPPHLRAYTCKLANSNELNKDERLRIAEFGLISLDEIDSMNNRELNQLKSVITATDVNERAAYAYTKERRVRLASFCASGNRRDFLTDITGNRRWLPFEVESIQNPFHTQLPYEQMYAQAWALANDEFFSYWFDLDEIEVLEQHNQHFRDESNEEQLLPILFDVPAEGKGEFLTTAQISERLITYGNIKKPMALSRLGMLLGAHGFQKKTIGVQRLRGWLVYQRSMDEINANKRLYAK
jgi:predicted P-loop ATPase